MTKTKIAAVLLGAGAGLVAGAPLAFAGDMPSHDGGDHGHSSHQHHGDHGKRGGDTCSVKGGSALAENNGGDALLANIIGQAPVGGLNAANITCSPFLNDNVKDNLNGNSINAAIL
ncbi:hypothetical protein GCM10023201_37110 [Actinomycetospora corticicola]|uniref:Small secreted domain DUF320 n=1 Tax=Actinomycetospora corticicola TaxID=663602 RepID=A0A7Y9J7B4_9PSEU|nr:hypothetical protein [Actinomycetospora corticicola]NYD38185.1 hypothetical protein [Actinomycetospora corticicola]